jgi:hypothetical protein
VDRGFDVLSNALGLPENTKAATATQKSKAETPAPTAVNKADDGAAQTAAREERERAGRAAHKAATAAAKAKADGDAATAKAKEAERAKAAEEYRKAQEAVKAADAAAQAAKKRPPPKSAVVQDETARAELQQKISDATKRSVIARSREDNLRYERRKLASKPDSAEYAKAVEQHEAAKKEVAAAIAEVKALSAEYFPSRKKAKAAPAPAAKPPPAETPAPTGRYTDKEWDLVETVSAALKKQVDDWLIAERYARVAKKFGVASLYDGAYPTTENADTNRAKDALRVVTEASISKNQWDAWKLSIGMGLIRPTDTEQRIAQDAELKEAERLLAFLAKREAPGAVAPQAVDALAESRKTAITQAAQEEDADYARKLSNNFDAAQAALPVGLTIVEYSTDGYVTVDDKGKRSRFTFFGTDGENWPVTMHKEPSAPASAVPAVEARPVDKVIENTLRLQGVEAQVRGIYRIPAKLMTVARRKALNVPRDKQSLRYEVKDWADISGDRSSRDKAIIDLAHPDRQRAVATQPPAPASADKVPEAASRIEDLKRTAAFAAVRVWNEATDAAKRDPSAANTAKVEAAKVKWYAAMREWEEAKAAADAAPVETLPPALHGSLAHEEALGNANTPEAIDALKESARTDPQMTEQQRKDFLSIASLKHGVLTAPPKGKRKAGKALDGSLSGPVDAPMTAQAVQAVLTSATGRYAAMTAPGGKVSVVDQPNMPWAARFQVQADGKWTIELNAAKMRDEAQVFDYLEHELAHLVTDTGELGHVLPLVTGNEVTEIRRAMKALGYKPSQVNAPWQAPEDGPISDDATELRARMVEHLKNQWKGRAWFTKLVGTVMRVAYQHGFRLTRLAAESIAARAIINATSPGGVSKYGGPMAPALALSERFNGITPAMDAEYLAAVQAGDMEAAQRMVDAAAKAAGYNVRAYHGTPFGRLIDRARRANLRGKEALANIPALESEKQAAQELFDEIHESLRRNQGRHIELKQKIKELEKERGAIRWEDEWRTQVREEKFKQWKELGDLIRDAKVEDQALFKEREFTLLPLSEEANAIYDAEWEKVNAQKRLAIWAKRPMAEEDVFDKSYWGSTDHGWLGQGFYFTTDRQDAEGYAQAPVRGPGDFETRDPFVYDAYLKVNNPYRPGTGMKSSTPETDEVAGIIMEQAGKTDPDRMLSAMAKIRTMEYLEAGYDGVIAPAEGVVKNEILVFDPSQIKSAEPVTRDDAGAVIPLSERFNPESPDVRYALAPPPLRTPIKLSTPEDLRAAIAGGTGVQYHGTFKTDPFKTLLFRTLQEVTNLAVHGAVRRLERDQRNAVLSDAREAQRYSSEIGKLADAASKVINDADVDLRKELYYVLQNEFDPSQVTGAGTPAVDAALDKVAAARERIDALGTQMQQNGYLNDQLNAIFEQNKGKWVLRAYRKFNGGFWPAPPLIEAAKKLLQSEVLTRLNSLQNQNAAWAKVNTLAAPFRHYSDMMLAGKAATDQQRQDAYDALYNAAMTLTNNDADKAGRYMGGMVKLAASVAAIAENMSAVLTPLPTASATDPVVFNVDMAALQQLLEAQVETLIKQDLKEFDASGVSRAFKTLRLSLIKRKDIAPEIRALYGEITDVAKAVQGSLNRLNVMNTKYHMQQQLLAHDNGMAVTDPRRIFSEVQTPEYRIRLVSKKNMEADGKTPKPDIRMDKSMGTTYGVLEGQYVRETDYEALQAIHDPSSPSSVPMRILAGVSAVARGAKVMLSPMSWQNMLVGNIFVYVGDGEWHNLKTAASGFIKMLKVMTDLSEEGAKKRDELIRAGILQGSVRVEEFQSMVREAFNSDPDSAEFAQGFRRILNYLLRKPIGAIGKAMGAWESLPKIAAYYAKLDRGVAPAEAARQIASVFPQPSLHPPLAKRLRYNPFTPDFVGFHFESVRSAINVWVEAKRAFARGDTREGMARMAGSAVVQAAALSFGAAGYAALYTAVKSMFMHDDDEPLDTAETNALKELLPDYMANQQLMVWYDKETGEYLVHSFGPMDPYAGFSAVLGSLTSGNAGSLTRAIFGPLIGLNMSADIAVGVFTGTNPDTGKTVWRKSDGWAIPFKMLAHASTSVAPSWVRAARRSVEIAGSEGDTLVSGATGTAETVGDVLTRSAVPGVEKTYNAKTLLRHKLSEAMRDAGAVRRAVGTVEGKVGRGEAGPSALQDVVEQLGITEANVSAKMLAPTIRAARLLGMSSTDIASAMINAGVPRTEIADIIKNQAFTPYGEMTPVSKLQFDQMMKDLEGVTDAMEVLMQFNIGTTRQQQELLGK